MDDDDDEDDDMRFSEFFRNKNVIIRNVTLFKVEFWKGIKWRSKKQHLKSIFNQLNKKTFKFYFLKNKSSKYFIYFIFQKKKKIE